MEARVSLRCDEVDDLYSLHRWLSGEEELRGAVRLIQPAPRANEMGGLPEALVVLLGTGGLGYVLGESLKAWLGQNRRAVLTLEVTKADERVSIHVDAHNTADALELLRKAVDGLDRGE